MNRRINILLLVHTFSDPGGTQKYIYELGKFLSEEFNVYECSFDANKEPHIFANKNKVLSLNVKKSNNFFIKLFGYFLKAYRLNKIKKEYQIDITISNLWPADFINFLSFGKGKLVSNGLVNVVGNAQNLPMLRYKKIVGLIYRNFDLTIAINEDLKSELENLFNLSSYKLKCIYAFVSLQNFESYTSIYDEKKSRIVWFGRLNHMKNLSPLFKILKNVKKNIPDVQLIVIGDGPHHSDLLNTARAYGHNVSDNLYYQGADVVFLGFVSDPYEYLVGCDVFALTSKSEGFGLVVVEAMSAGLPILASDCPTGGPHLIMNGKDCYLPNREFPELTKYGYLLPIPDEADDVTCCIWQAKIEELLSDPLTRREMGLNSKIRSVDFSTNKIKNQWFSVIKELTL